MQSLRAESSAGLEVSPALEKGQNMRAVCSSCSAAIEDPEEDSLVGMGGENEHVCVVSCFILFLI